MDGTGAMILTGGASIRMGADKAAQEWASQRAVDRVSSLASCLGVAVCLTVGHTDYGLPFITDETPRAGPVGGVLAGAAALRLVGSMRALVLAVDAPTITEADVLPLLKAEGRAVAYQGLNLPFVAHLSALPLDAPANWALWRLLEATGVWRLPVTENARLRLRGANTPTERHALLRALGS